MHIPVSLLESSVQRDDTIRTDHVHLISAWMDTISFVGSAFISEDSKRPFKSYLTLYIWTFDTPPSRNANNFGPYTFNANLQWSVFNPLSTPLALCNTQMAPKSTDTQKKLHDCVCSLSLISPGIADREEHECMCALPRLGPIYIIITSPDSSLEISQNIFFMVGVRMSFREY